MAGARSHDELDAWRLANELKVGVYALIRSGPILHDLDFRDQIRNSAAGAPRLIAEGFGRYVPREFIKYLRWANGELHETSNHLKDGFDRRYFEKSDVERLTRLAKRASKAASGLIRYLERCPDPGKRPRNENPKNRNRQNQRENREPNEPEPEPAPEPEPQAPDAPDEPNEPE